MWDGSEGAEETNIIESLGLLVVTYEVRFWFYELIEMLPKLLLTAVLVIYLSASIWIAACCLAVRQSFFFFC